jgi:hypothetical protein
MLHAPSGPTWFPVELHNVTDTYSSLSLTDATVAYGQIVLGIHGRGALHRRVLGHTYRVERCRRRQRLSEGLCSVWQSVLGSCRAPLYLTFATNRIHSTRLFTVAEQHTRAATMSSATASAPPLPTRPVDPVVPTLILADYIDINMAATKIQRSFANLIRQLHRGTLDVRAAPRVIKNFDSLYRYLYYLPDASGDEPLCATTILEVSRDVLGSRHACSYASIDCAGRSCHALPVSSKLFLAM